MVGRADIVSIDRSGLIFRKHDRDFGADAGAGGAVGLAVVVVLHLDFVFGADAIDIKETKAQALHAIGAAGVIDNRKPGFPLSRFIHRLATPGFFHEGDDAVRIQIRDVSGLDLHSPGGVFEFRCLARRKGAQEKQGVVIGGGGAVRS